MSNQLSGGRGGAGNIRQKAESSEVPSTDDLKTPTIKQTTYTTGRGGAGNMAANDSPENARRAQDVDTPAAHQREMKGTYHWGRGGEGNKTLVGGGEREESKSPMRSGGDGRRRSSMKDRAKETLGLNKEKEKKGADGGDAVAVED